MNQPTLVVMAAGMGSRFGGLKQLIPVDAQGHPIIDFSMYDARRAAADVQLNRALEVRHALHGVVEIGDGLMEPLQREDGLPAAAFLPPSEREYVGRQAFLLRFERSKRALLHFFNIKIRKMQDFIL